MALRPSHKAPPKEHLSDRVCGIARKENPADANQTGHDNASHSGIRRVPTVTKKLRRGGTHHVMHVHFSAERKCDVQEVRRPKYGGYE